MSKKKNGLGMIKTNHFWRSVRMFWLRRLSISNSTWDNLHKIETKLCTFNPITYSWKDLEYAWNNMNNIVQREIYDLLSTCRKNGISIHPLEYLSVPINGGPSLTINNTPGNNRGVEM